MGMINNIQALRAFAAKNKPCQLAIVAPSRIEIKVSAVMQTTICRSGVMVGFSSGGLG